MRKLISGILMLVCCFGATANAMSVRLPGETLRYQQNVHDLQNVGCWSEEGRRRMEGQHRRDEERRRMEEQRRRDEERRRMEEQRRRDEEQRRRDEEQRRRDKEQRRRDEEQHRRDEERHRRDDERHRWEDEQRRRDEERRRWVEERRWDDRHHHDFNRYERSKAREVLRVTADYLIRAQRAARLGHYHFGLGKAYAHQEEARRLYRDGFYRRAIAHSLRARQIAQDVIDGNRAGYPRYPCEYDETIDNELSVRVHDDRSVLSLRITL